MTVQATLNDQADPNQGQLVLDNNAPAVAADANRHGSNGPSRRTAVAAATPITSTASANGDPAGTIGAAIGSKATTQRVKCSRIRTATNAKRRNHPRTVDRSRPSTAAIAR